MLYPESLVIRNVCDYIQEVTASNLGQWIDFLEVLHGFADYLQANARVMG